jgi:hypothetical protein
MHSRILVNKIDNFVVSYVILVSFFAYTLNSIQVTTMLTQALLASRDALLILHFISLFIRPAVSIDIIHYSLLFFILVIYAISFSFFMNIDVYSFAYKYRSVLSFTYLYLLIQHVEFNNNVIKKFAIFFIVICSLEILSILLNAHSIFLDMIGFSFYNFQQGNVGFSDGLFSQYRLLTPAFQPSLGGYYAALVAIFFLEKRKFLSFISILVVLFTFSKTGMIFLMLFWLIRRFPSSIFLIILSVIQLSWVFSFLGIDSIHIGSINYHLKGLSDGFSFMFQPLGVGATGTIPWIYGAEVGAESGLGLYLAALGLPGLLLIVFQYINVKNKVIFSSFILIIAFVEITFSLSSALILFAFLSTLEKKDLKHSKHFNFNQAVFNK